VALPTSFAATDLLPDQTPYIGFFLPHAHFIIPKTNPPSPVDAKENENTLFGNFPKASNHHLRFFRRYVSSWSLCSRSPSSPPTTFFPTCKPIVPVPNSAGKLDTEFLGIFSLSKAGSLMRNGGY
jgi:hypothetical protein